MICNELNKDKCCCFCGKEKDKFEKTYILDNEYLSCEECFIEHNPR